MTDTIRRGIIADDLIQAYQDETLTTEEYQTALWVLGACDWKVQNVTGISNDLLNKMLAASRLLSSDILAPASVTEERRTAIISRPDSPVESYGFTSPSDNTTLSRN